MEEPLVVGGVVIRNRVFLAPMSGVTDLPFRDRAYRHGAGLVISEMVASGELARGHMTTRRRIGRGEDGVHMVQLAGRDPILMAEAATIAEGEGADIIDINMGCPAKKVTGGLAGSALMRDLDCAISIVDAVVGAVKVPVTVKMRLGWDEGSLNAPELARRAEQAGVRMVTVHGRTRCQFYQGKADWRAISAVKKAVNIPVVANGDVGSRQDAAIILEQSGADAVMVGRASFGAPWIAGELATSAGRAAAPTALADASAMAGYVVAHYEDMLSHHGIEAGRRQARKHLGWYLDRHTCDLPPERRREILASDEPGAVVFHLRRAFAEFPASPLRSAA